ncbi:hypothetical protein [Brachybacterium sp.]|uniref:hypothetical protein n=1 Tax=Brachybacterium sp. TaxID=1891286 RepID=UPI003F904D02
MTTQPADPQTMQASLGHPAGHRRTVAPADLADGILLAVLPLLAVGLSRSPVLTSLLPAAAWLPWLLLGLAAGVLIDRADRRRVRTAALAARVVLLVAMAAIATMDQLAPWPLLAGAAAAFGLAVTWRTASPPLIGGPTLPDAPSPLMIQRRRARLRSVERESTAAAHRARATDHLVRAGLHHLR